MVNNRSPAPLSRANRAGSSCCGLDAEPQSGLRLLATVENLVDQAARLRGREADAKELFGRLDELRVERPRSQTQTLADSGTCNRSSARYRPRRTWVFALAKVEITRRRKPVRVAVFLGVERATRIRARLTVSAATARRRDRIRSR